MNDPTDRIMQDAVTVLADGDVAICADPVSPSHVAPKVYARDEHGTWHTHAYDPIPAAAVTVWIDD